MLNAGDRRAALVISAGSNRRANHVSPDKKLLWAERQRQLGARQLSRTQGSANSTSGFDQTLRVWAKSEFPGFLLGKRWVSAPVFAQMGQVSGEVARNLFFQTAQVSKKVARNSQSGQSKMRWRGVHYGSLQRGLQIHLVESRLCINASPLPRV